MIQPILLRNCAVGSIMGRMDEETSKYFQEDPACSVAWGMASGGEHRWPATIAVLFAGMIYLGIPHGYTVVANWIIPTLELAILAPLSILAPRRTANEGKVQQILAMAIIGVVGLANLGSLLLLVQTLIIKPSHITGPEILSLALIIWTTNIIVFGLWFWELDRGGPDERSHKYHRAPDFLFPQMSTPGCSTPGWAPHFIDYLYLAFTNATAFSPTDAMPLTKAAKILMLLEAVISLLTVTLAAARAVNILAT